MRRLEPQVQVRCAYLELTPPSLPEVAADMIAYGASQIRVVPLFLGVGRHAREDLPVLMNALCQSHPQVVFKLEPAVGENPAIVEALARTALG
jgi:sirohydrochlorin cobaltochelatase